MTQANRIANSNNGPVGRNVDRETVAYGTGKTLRSADVGKRLDNERLGYALGLAYRRLCRPLPVTEHFA